MKKFSAVIICIVLLASCLSFPSTARGDGSDFILSPGYWFLPGNIYNSLYTGDSEGNNASKKSRYTYTPFIYNEPASPREIMFWAGVALTSFAIFCYGNNKMDQKERGK